MKSIIYILSFFLLTSISFAQTKSYQLSSHILDISTGTVAPDVSITLHKMNKDKSWAIVSQHKTDKNGRVTDLLPYAKMDNDGIYQLTFETYPYFESKKVDSFYPFVEVIFYIKGKEHFHVPITISPFGYSTYRGN